MFQSYYPINDGDRMTEIPVRFDYGCDKILDRIKDSDGLYVSKEMLKDSIRLSLVGKDYTNYENGFYYISCTGGYILCAEKLPEEIRVFKVLNDYEYINFVAHYNNIIESDVKTLH